MNTIDSQNFGEYSIFNELDALATDKWGLSKANPGVQRIPPKCLLTGSKHHAVSLFGKMNPSIGWRNVGGNRIRRPCRVPLYFLSLLEGYWIKFVFILCVPWLIIKISIIVLTPHLHQLPSALFVRRWRFRLVKNRNRKLIRVHSVCSVANH